MKSKSFRVGSRFISIFILAAALVLLWAFHKDASPDSDDPISPVAKSASVSAKNVPAAGVSKTNKNPLPFVSAGNSIPSPTGSFARIVFSLPYTLSASANTSWIGNWGMFSGANGALDFGASSSTTGGAAFLDGSEAWKDYKVETGVRWVKGESFGIVARMSDAGNFVYCNFGDHYVRALIRIGGNDTALNEGVAPNGTAGSSEQLGIRVYGNKMACTVDGKDVLTAAAEKISASGGIGVLSWDPVANNSEIVVSGLQVTTLGSDDIVLGAPAPAVTKGKALSAPLPLPYKKSNFTGDADWQKTWGSMAVDQNGLMNVSANSLTTGASVMLANADKWGDYKFSATIDWLQGETFGLIARYQDDNNYTICLFDQQFAGTVRVQMQQHVNGNVVTLVDGDITNFNQLRGPNIAVSIEVMGTEGICSFAGHAILSQGSGNHLYAPYKGGPGFTIWDPAANNAGIVVRDVAVEGTY